jgi:hypothetical protein
VQKPPNTAHAIAAVLDFGAIRVPNAIAKIRRVTIAWRNQ